ncbi:hypothetical protein GCM10022202_18000 [Microbacterium marinilacus]|uniref:EamA domain-containing protein n=1 Tax=Microbacterium marinilacus TaxID=415209 RepID=A0ABP7BFN8_9MICO
MLLTAVAPISWGATYFVTREFLPADAPLWGSALRALPAGIALALLARRQPRGDWWWRSAVLGLLNVGAFFLLVYVSAQTLPTSVASSVMALAPLALAGSAWLLVAERPGLPLIAGATVAIGGTLLLVWRGAEPASPSGLASSAGALALSSLGAVLGRRWADGTPLLATTAWQLLAGGVMLAVTAGAVEGTPPALGPTQWTALAFVSLVATGLAYVCWFGGIARLRAGLVGTIGLLNPLTGTLLGATLGGETLAAPQWCWIGLVLLGILVAQRRSGGGAMQPPSDDAEDAGEGDGEPDHRERRERRAERQSRPHRRRRGRQEEPRACDERALLLDQEQIAAEPTEECERDQHRHGSPEGCVRRRRQGARDAGDPTEHDGGHARMHGQ